MYQFCPRGHYWDFFCFTTNSVRSRKHMQISIILCPSKYFLNDTFSIRLVISHLNLMWMLKTLVLLQQGQVLQPNQMFFVLTEFFVQAIERFAGRSPSVPCSLLFPAFQGYHSYGVVTFRVSLICERVSHLILIGCYKSCDIRIIKTLSHRMASTSLVTSVNASRVSTQEEPNFV